MGAFCSLKGDKMKINLYAITDDPRRVRKDLANKSILTDQIVLNPTEIVDVINPTIIISYFAGVEACNYIHLDTLHRYYFAKPELVPGGRVSLKCVVDPLMSFPITGCDVFVDRSDGMLSDVKDNLLPIKNQSNIAIRTFPNSPHIDNGAVVRLNFLEVI